MRRALAAIPFLWLWGATPAHAGALGEVVGGLVQATGNPSCCEKKEGSSGGGHSAGDVAGAIAEGLVHGIIDHRSPGDGGAYTPLPESSVSPLSGPQTTRPMDLFFYLGFQSVTGSDASASVEARAAYDDFAIGLRGTAFYERADASPGTRYLELDLASMEGQYRVVRGRTQVWLMAGIGGVSTVDSIHLAGVGVGARFEHKVGGEIRVSGEARNFWLQDNVRAVELVASAQLSIVRLSYRFVDFSVGPPLQGPEIGVVLKF